MSVTITGLPAAPSALTGAEVVPVVQSGTTVRTTTQDIADLGGGSGLPDQTGHSGEFLTTNGTDASWGDLEVEGLEVGYLDVPQNIQDADYTFSLTDRGKHVYQSSAGTVALWLVPTNASVAFPIGTAISLVNDGPQFFVEPDVGVTLVLAGSQTVSSCQVDNLAMATLLKVDDDRWYINGVGISVPA